MAFVCTVVEGQNLQFHVATNGSERVVQACVGYDNETDKTISILASLSPQAGSDMEVTFCVIETDIDDGTEHLIFNGAETRHRISDVEDRQKVLGAILMAIDLMIKRYSPSLVYHATYSAHLPDNALVKHERVNGVFRRNGYIVDENEPYNGQRIWVIYRPV